MSRIGEKGSVMLEFVLVIPIYMLLFGATLLMLELTLGRLHLQEANRNLAFLAFDRERNALGGSDFDDKLRIKVAEHFDFRNQLENALTKGEKKYFYDFSEDRDYWAVELWEKSLADEKFESGTQGVKWNWGMLKAGNMVVKVPGISGLYIGAIALSEVMHSPADGDVSLYRASYDLTRTIVPKDNSAQTAAFVPESVVLTRIPDYETEFKSRVSNYVKKVYEVSTQPWPMKTEGTTQSTDSFELDDSIHIRLLYPYTQ